MYNAKPATDVLHIALELVDPNAPAMQPVKGTKKKNPDSDVGVKEEIIFKIAEVGIALLPSLMIPMMYFYNSGQFNNHTDYGGLLKAFFLNSQDVETSHVELISKSELLSAKTGAQLFENDKVGRQNNPCGNSCATNATYVLVAVGLKREQDMQDPNGQLLLPQNPGLGPLADKVFFRNRSS